MDGILLLLVSLPLIVHASDLMPCCWFKQWEGFIAQKNGVYNRIGNFASLADIQGHIHVDYDRLMVVNDLVVTNASQVTALTTIEDFNKKILYTIVDGQCFKTTSRGNLDDSCVPEKATLLGTHTYLGIVADTWLLPYYSKTLTYTVRVTVTRDQCIPLQEVLLTIADTSQLSLISMQNVTQGIVDPSIFNIPSICQQVDFHGAEVPRVNTIGLHSFVKQKIF